MNEAHNEFVDYKKQPLFCNNGLANARPPTKSFSGHHLMQISVLKSNGLLSQLLRRSILLQRNTGEISLLISCGKVLIRRLSPNVA